MEQELKNEEKQTEERLSDLPIGTEQAEEAKGGVTVNFPAIKLAYKPQRPDGSLDS